MNTKKEYVETSENNRGDKMPIILSPYFVSYSTGLVMPTSMRLPLLKMVFAIS